MTPLEAIRAVFAAWEAGDADALRDLFCEDGVYLDPLKDGPLEGRDAIVEGNRPAMAAITECRIEVRHGVETGETGMVEGFFASRLATGDGRLDFPFAVVGQLRDGRIARLAEYFDTARG
ncbi:MAG TPA: nuclear transport factor 2 family protein [Solirubrobacteraceae bacterium]|jgi:ketosteroid isomerase-like protein